MVVPVCLTRTLFVLSCAEEAENWLRANAVNWMGALRSPADRSLHSAVVD